jgi:O-antigen/teichoic acid export membrane protein
MSWKPPGSRALASGVLWNGLGQGLPLLAAVLLVPRLVHGLGVDRFGVLSLAWLLIGYFTLFDLGVSGALTRLVSERLARSRHDEVPPLVWTSLALTTVMGLVGGALLAALAPWLVERALRIPAELRPEALRLVAILAATLPVVTGTAALTGVLAAQHRFGALNAVRVPLGVLTYAAPVAVLPFSASLVAAALALAAVRVAAGLAYLALCLAGTPGLRDRVAIVPGLVRPILGFGSWMTVTAVVGPLMVYFDRFLIGALLSMAMVAYYTAPYDMVSRLALLSLPVVNVLFPAIAASFDADRPRAARLFDWALRVVAALLFPLALVLVVFAPEALRLWLGAEFAVHGTTVLRLLTVGVFLNALAQVALALVQGSGRPDLGAKLHVAELPFYLAALWLLVHARGIEGAAIAWLARVAVDALALFAMARRRLGPGVAPPSGALGACAAAAAALVAGCLLPGLAARTVFTMVALVAYGVVAWRFVARPGALAVLARPHAGPAA